ncbi:hypothetical protein [Sphingomonas cavernae]|nr:hypothetical protein [Sphingomonas cavernae]
MTSEAPPTPTRRLCIGVTGHRASHPGVAANHARIEACFGAILARISDGVATAPAIPGAPPTAPTRLHCLLADGTDQLAARLALDHGWELSCPLPFGRQLNTAINSAPVSYAAARALLAGGLVADGPTAGRAAAIEALCDKARLFELAERDTHIAALFLARCESPDAAELARLFNAETSQRVALAGIALVEQSDIVIALWDGITTAHVGGTGHTMVAALDRGAPVLWIDPAEPEAWRILHAPESLATLTNEEAADGRDAALVALVHTALDPDGEAPQPRPAGDRGLATLTQERWHARSNPLAHGYRRVEALFGDDAKLSPFRSIRQRYEPPEAIGSGSGAALLAEVSALPQGDPMLAGAIDRAVLRRFAWADGVSSRLSDAYRGGMMVSFLLSSLAVVGGIIYLPFFSTEGKWPFALLELLLVAGILIITFVGQRRRWHGRWFETRRVAEYLRHSPLLILLGVTRPPGRWPRGTTTSWPEWYARQAIREIGLPRVAMTPAYLRQALEGPLAEHVASQRDYHFDKAHRLKRVHHRLDLLSGVLFLLAVISVVAYLALKLATSLGHIESGLLAHASKYFTLFGVIFPSFASAIAGIRFFGDFERFAAISEVAAEKLDAVHRRIKLLLSAPDSALDYACVAELVHATDAIVVAEIESWQSVFGGKQISIPA